MASEYEELSKRAKENPASLSDADVERYAQLAQQQSVDAQQKSTEQARKETGLKDLPLHDYAGLSNQQKKEIAKKAAEDRAAAGRSGSQPRRRGRS